MKYLIWSNEHEAWWGPGECGYVTVISKAGRYPLERAGQIVKQANIVQDAHGIEPHEVMVLAPECATEAFLVAHRLMLAYIKPAPKSTDMNDFRKATIYDVLRTYLYDDEGVPRSTLRHPGLGDF
jgi:hypothetical protein